jgi:demethylmenaquinone methyltransferase/2-methoxy-6-polyprenyl-1,4-benzoquinol methylase
VRLFKFAEENKKGAFVAMTKDPRGLWEDVLDVPSQIISVYDKMNWVMSMGQDISYRKQGISRALGNMDLVLDAGSGPGVMSEVALSSGKEILGLVLLDPLRPMLNIARKRLRFPKAEFIQSMFELAPFKSNTFNMVMCGFSLRDARNFGEAINEITRVLKGDSGRLLVVDLGKPDNRIIRWFVGGYWRLIVPLMASALVGFKKGRLYSALYKTYRKHPKNSEMETIFRNKFRELELIEKAMGAATIIVASQKGGAR